MTGKEHRSGDWQRAISVEELGADTLKACRLAGKQLVLGQTQDGTFFALDNRCPHEGYPLATGFVKDCLLTCAWHNWKFDVRDGKNVLGGEGVRSYPVRVKGDSLEVDLEDPDPIQLVAIARASLAEAIYDHDNGRAIRDGVRLLSLGHDANELLAEVAAYDAEHAEYGSSHVLPLAADCARLAHRLPGVTAMQAIAPVLDLCGEINRRLAPIPLPDPISSEGLDAGAEIRQAVADEDSDRALGLLLGAFDAGESRKNVESWLYAVCSDHFTDFGHQLIYLVKAQELLDRVDDGHARAIYPGLLRSIILATREDTLPYLRPYASRLRDIEDRLPSLYEGAGRETDLSAIVPALLDGSVDDASGAVQSALEGGASAVAIAKELVVAAATRVLRFNESLDRDPEVAEGWLWVTHRMTFACAVRNAVSRWEHPDSLRFLFQAVAFIHSGRPMDSGNGGAVRMTDDGSELDVADVVQAIAHSDPDVALNAVRSVLHQEGRMSELESGLDESLLSGSLVRPIFVAHAIKMTVAAFEEYRTLADHEGRSLPIQAAIRFLASPVAERGLPDQVGRAIDFVVDGKVPRKLTQ